MAVLADVQATLQYLEVQRLAMPATSYDATVITQSNALASQIRVRRLSPQEAKAIANAIAAAAFC